MIGNDDALFGIGQPVEPGPGHCASHAPAHLIRQRDIADRAVRCDGAGAHHHRLDNAFQLAQRQLAGLVGRKPAQALAPGLGRAAIIGGAHQRRNAQPGGFCRAGLRIGIIQPVRAEDQRVEALTAQQR